jgi:hypothetical protein
MFGAGALALAEGPLAAGVTAAAMGGALILGDRGTVSYFCEPHGGTLGSVAPPAVAAGADIKDLPATVKPAKALAQQERLIGNGLRRHASPGRLDNGKPYVSVFRSQRMVTGFPTVAESGPCRCHGRVPCPSCQQHHTLGKPRRRAPR